MLVSLPFAAAAQDVSGRYTVEGRNFDGSRYRGTSPRSSVTSKNTCRIAWNTGSSVGRASACGTASPSRRPTAPGSTIGLVIYEIRPDGRIEGLWTIADQNGVGTETLIPQ